MPVDRRYERFQEVIARQGREIADLRSLVLSRLGLSLVETVYYTTPGADTFVKANFPGLRAVIVKCQGAGGGSGGGANADASQLSISGGGGGGGYAESLILAADLDTTEAIAVGAGGAKGAAGNNNGSAGGDSVFDTISGEVRGVGGVGGVGGATGAALTGTPGGGGAGGGGTGDLVIPGDKGISGFALAANRVFASVGGRSFLGANQTRNVAGADFSGSDGVLYGGGASGAGSVNGGGAVEGGNGADGIVIVDVYK